MTKGFTLIETIIAISLLTTGVVGSFALMQRVTSFTSISSSQFIASYLAQEGIEIIRNIRDTNYLELQDWDGGIDNANTGADFRLDYSSEEFPDMTCGNYLQHDGNYYVCSDEGKFQRKITITKEPALKKMVVSV
ncbi:MAG: prepilin-type N-terminal cleavage/methylation domain-containing protein, partial [bacterium]